MGAETDGQPPRQPQITPLGGTMTRTGMRHPGSRQYSRGMMLAGWAAIGLAVILVSGTLYGYVKYRNVLDGIKHETISVGSQPPKPTACGRPSSMRRASTSTTLSSSTSPASLA